MQKLIDLLKGKDVAFWMLVMLLVLSITSLAWYSLIMGKQLDGISIVLAALINILTLLINYRYGSSKGSKEKTELLNQDRLKG